MALFSFSHQMEGRKLWVLGEVVKERHPVCYVGDEGIEEPAEPEFAEVYAARSDMFPGYQASAQLMSRATDAYREGLAGWLESHPEQVPERRL